MRDFAASYSRILVAIPIRLREKYTLTSKTKQNLDIGSKLRVLNGVSDSKLISLYITPAIMFPPHYSQVCKIPRPYHTSQAWAPVKSGKTSQHGKGSVGSLWTLVRSFQNKQPTTVSRRTYSATFYSALELTILSTALPVASSSTKGSMNDTLMSASTILEPAPSHLHRRPSHRAVFCLPYAR